MTRLTDFVLAQEGISVTLNAIVIAMLDPFVYQCFASHNDPDGTDDFAFFTIFINPFFSFTAPPVVLFTNNDTFVTPCIGNGNPIPQVRLLFGDDNTLIEDNVNSSFTGTIVFGNEGNYSCIASTPGADQDAVFSFIVISMYCLILIIIIPENDY